MQVACLLKVFVPNLYIKFSSIRATARLIILDLMIITRLVEELTFIKLLNMQSTPASLPHSGVQKGKFHIRT
jgi:hypothetical protein